MHTDISQVYQCTSANCLNSVVELIETHVSLISAVRFKTLSMHITS